MQRVLVNLSYKNKIKILYSLTKSARLTLESSSSSSSCGRGEEEDGEMFDSFLSASLLPLDSFKLHHLGVEEEEEEE